MNMETMSEVFKGAACAGVAAALFALYLFATPDQVSAECERERVAIEAEAGAE